MTTTDLSAWLDLTQQAVSSLDPRNRVVEAFWKKGLRSDGRLFAQTRPYTVQHGILAGTTSAAGSALVKCGFKKNASSSSKSASSTIVVMAAVTLLVGQPSAVAPNQGDVVVTVTSPTVSAARNANSTQPALLSFLQRTLEENLDLEQLILVEGKLAYRLAVSISILDNGGGSTNGSSSIRDVCLAAAVAALLDTRLPARPLIQDGVVYSQPLTAQKDGEERDYKSLGMPIIPCSLTAASADFTVENDEDTMDDRMDLDASASSTTGRAETRQHHWIVDPDGDEQQVQSSAVTIVVNARAATAAAGGGDVNDESILAIHICPAEPLPATATMTTAPAVLSAAAATSPAVIRTSDLALLMEMAKSHAQSLSTVLSQQQ